MYSLRIAISDEQFEQIESSQAEPDEEYVIISDGTKGDDGIGTFDDAKGDNNGIGTIFEDVKGDDGIGIMSYA